MNRPTNNNRLKAAEWQGYVTARLEDIKEDLIQIKKDVGKCQVKMDSIRLKVAGISSVVALLVTIVVFVVKHLIAR